MLLKRTIGTGRPAVRLLRPQLALFNSRPLAHPSHTPPQMPRNRSLASRQSLPVNTIIKFVPQQEAWIVERFGKFNRVLEPGLNILIPIVDEIKYVKSLKEVAIEIPSQSAITEDNVTLAMDGVLYYRVVNPYKASYGVEDHEFAISQLAQTTMRAEIGRLTLDKTLADRARLNVNIVDAINHASAEWGIQCLRYEIRDIHPPEEVVQAMHSQVSAERQKRAEILASEGRRQAAINDAEGDKQATILAAEAEREEKVNQAKGEAAAISLKAKATAESIEMVSQSMEKNSMALSAVSLKVAEQYIQAFSGVAKEGTTVLMDSKVGDPSSMIVKALSVYENVKHGLQSNTHQSPSPVSKNSSETNTFPLK